MSHYSEFRDNVITLPNQNTVPQSQFDQIVYERNQLLRLLLNFMSMDEILKDIKHHG